MDASSNAAETLAFSVWSGDTDFGIIYAVDANDAIMQATLDACSSLAQALDSLGGITEEEYFAGFDVRQV